MRFRVLIPVLAALAAACGEPDAPAADAPAAAAPPSAAILTPDSAALAAPAPDSFVVRFTTSRGEFDVKVHRAWAPIGAGRLYYLVGAGFYDGVRFFRVLEGFMAQFGAHGNPAVAAVWRDRRIQDDPVRHRNERGALTFAMTSEPNTRTTQLFINFGNNQQLDGAGFAPLGEVVSGMAVVDSLFNAYGEGAPGGPGPSQDRIAAEGNAYLQREFPKLDHIVTARIVLEWRKK